MMTRKRRIHGERGRSWRWRSASTFSTLIARIEPRLNRWADRFVTAAITMMVAVILFHIARTALRFTGAL